MAVDILVRTTDGPAGRKRGDIISAKGTPHNGWGDGENLPNYLVIRINNIKLMNFSDYHKRHEYVNPNDTMFGYRRSRYHLDLDNMPTDYGKGRPHLLLNLNDILPHLIEKAYS